MRRDIRLRSGDDIRRVRRDGRSRANSLVVVLAAPRPEGPNEPTRIGVVAGKRVGDAVVRNRAKRRIREQLRCGYGQLKSGWDIVVIVRATLAGADSALLGDGLWSLLRRLDLVVDASCAALPSA